MAATYFPRRWLFSALLAAVLLHPAPARAQGRIVIETIDGRQVITYLPPGYDGDAGRRYPVVYLLHGGGGTPQSFLAGNYSGLNIMTTMNNLVRLNVVREMIIVMPDINGVYQDFIATELVGHVDATYRTIARRQSRGIGGHSRGGCGAFLLATDHPELFSAVYGMSASCLDRETERVEGAPGQGLREPLAARIAGLKPAIEQVKVAFDVGTEDRLLRANQSLAAAMERAGIPHAFEAYPGDHNGVIRQRIATKLLPFFSRELAAY
ncbi:MAG: esterase family protein [Acidobacteria bacterium]|nr:esterase family protein [Acidobacteriota bacterium]